MISSSSSPPYVARDGVSSPSSSNTVPMASPSRSSSSSMSSYQKYCYIMALLVILFFPLLFFRRTDSDEERWYGGMRNHDGETGAFGRYIDHYIESSDVFRLQVESGYIHYDPRVSISSKYFGASSAYIDLRNLTYQLQYNRWGYSDDVIIMENNDDGADNVVVINTHAKNNDDDDDDDNVKKQQQEHLWDRKVLDVVIFRVPSFSCPMDGSYYRRRRDYQKNERKKKKQQNNNDPPYVNPDPCSFQRMGIGYYPPRDADDGASVSDDFYDNLFHDSSTQPVQLCCSYQDIQNGYCPNNLVPSSSMTKNSNVSIPYLNRDTFKGWYRNIPLNDQELVSSTNDPNFLIPIKQSGLYVILYIDCMNFATNSEIKVNGTLQFKSSKGYLPGELHYFLHWFMIITIAYVVFFLYWTYHWLLRRHRAHTSDILQHHHIIMNDLYDTMTTPFTGGNNPPPPQQQPYSYQPVTDGDSHRLSTHVDNQMNLTTTPQQQQQQQHNTISGSVVNEVIRQQQHLHQQQPQQHPSQNTNHDHNMIKHPISPTIANKKPSKGFILFGLIFITIIIGMVEMIIETSTMVQWHKKGGDYQTITTNEKSWIGSLLYVLRSGLLRCIALLVAKGFGYTNIHIILKHVYILQQQREQRWLTGTPTRADRLYYVWSSYKDMMTRCFHKLCITLRWKQRGGYHYHGTNHDDDTIVEPRYAVSSNQYWYSVKLCFAYIGITELIFMSQTVLLNTFYRMSYYLIVDFSIFISMLVHMKRIIELIFIILICISLYQTKLYYSLECKERMQQPPQPPPPNSQPNHATTHTPPSDSGNNLPTSLQSSTVSTVTVIKVLQKLERLTLFFRCVAFMVIVVIIRSFFVVRREFYNHYYPFYVYRAFLMNLYHELLQFIVLIGIALIIGPNVGKSTVTSSTAGTTAITSSTRNPISSMTGNVGFMMTSFASSTLPPQSTLDPAYTELLLQEDHGTTNHLHQRIHHHHDNHGMNPLTMHEDFIDDDDDAIDENGIEL